MQAGAGSDSGVVGLLLRLREAGVSDTEFLKAVEGVPRDRFVPAEFSHLTWADESIPIACGQTMYAPDLVVRLVHALDVQPRHAVLEIGTGSGYQTALLARFARKVHSVDRYSTLMQSARKRIAALGHNNVAFQQTDGRDLSKDDGLYDRILVDSFYDGMPRDMNDKLVAGGIMIAAIGNPREEQMLVKLTKIGSRFEREDLFPVRFSALEPGIARAL